MMQFKFALQNCKTAKDLYSIASQQVQIIKNLFQELKRSESLKSLYLLDQISYEGCRILDTSTIIQQFHPKSEWRQAAAHAQDEIQQLFNDLNSDKSLFNQFLHLKYNNQIFYVFNNEEQQFVNSIIQEFLQQGICCDIQKVQELEQQEETLKSEFEENIHNSRIKFEFLYEHIDKIPQQYLPQRQGDMYPESFTSDLKIEDALTLLNIVNDELIRKKLLEAMNCSVPWNKEVLQNLIMVRNQKAQLLGFDNYIDYALSHQSFKIKPQKLKEILYECYSYTEKKLRNELEILYDMKARMVQQDRLNPIKLQP